MKYSLLIAGLLFFFSCSKDSDNKPAVKKVPLVRWDIRLDAAGNATDTAFYIYDLENRLIYSKTWEGAQHHYVHSLTNIVATTPDSVINNYALTPDKRVHSMTTKMPGSNLLVRTDEWLYNPQKQLTYHHQYNTTGTSGHAQWFKTIEYTYSNDNYTRTKENYKTGEMVETMYTYDSSVVNTLNPENYGWPFLGKGNKYARKTAMMIAEGMVTNYAYVNHVDSLNRIDSVVIYKDGVRVGGNKYVYF